VFEGYVESNGGFRGDLSGTADIAKSLNPITIVDNV
jgi:hypothetical protein